MYYSSENISQESEERATRSILFFHGANRSGRNRSQQPHPPTTERKLSKGERIKQRMLAIKNLAVTVRISLPPASIPIMHGLQKRHPQSSVAERPPKKGTLFPRLCFCLGSREGGEKSAFLLRMRERKEKGLPASKETSVLTLNACPV